MGRGASLQLTRTHRILIGLVVAGAVLIAGIGFAGSYAAVRELALQKGFGDFSLVFPIGIDAGICVLLALDLLLTWLRIPFPLLRQTAWLLTAATIAFNGAAAWPDPLGVGMHAVIPVLFVVSVEAARHAVGRIADITADKHMEGVRLTRWLLSPVPTFKLWRRMKLWELRSYEQVIKLEQDRLIYQARLQARFGRNWRRKAPVESLMPLRLAKYGVPLAETAAAGLAAAGIEPALLPPAPAQAARVSKQRQNPVLESPAAQEMKFTQLRAGEPHPSFQVPSVAAVRPHEPTPDDARAGGRLADAYRAWIGAYGSEPTSAQFALWLQDRYGIATAAGDPLSDEQLRPLLQVLKQCGAPAPDGGSGPGASQDASEEETWTDYFYNAWLTYAAERSSYPDADALAEYVYQRDGILGATGQPVTADELRRFVALFQEQGQDDTEADPALGAAGQDVDTAPGREGEESHDEDPLPSSPDNAPGEQPDASPWIAAGQQDETRVVDRHAVHASAGGRSAVQARVPKPRDEDEPVAGESAPDISGSNAEQEAEQQDGLHLTGPARVEFHYRQLSPEEQQLSAKALAPVLAERCGYQEGTVRKYLGPIKRAASV
ncbi:DUF2637 domain-containing protein [Streptomyces sp. NPDC088846]|uniref:DUF2637 domain-containing protein n=1 Tax=Streptomyces sp. NPDC088846 TaxID=3365908 RepID=UPI0037F466C4